MMDSEGVVFLKAVSTLCGWSYFLAWSLSFYPQPFKNYMRGSTSGLTFDFPFINTLGFASYTITQGCLLFSPTIRAQYASRHPASPKPTVQVNDFVFALHGFILCVITYTQFYPCIWGLKVSSRTRASRPTTIIFWGCIAAVLLACFVVEVHGKNGGYDPKGLAWIDVIIVLGYVKLVATLVKYIPQVNSNYRRKSTVGWSIGQILLDVSGSILSLLQLVIDSSLQADWSGITGNTPKLFLANITLVFDAIFLTQHFILYKDATSSNETYEESDSDDDVTQAQPLLSG
ncbi:PQ-loop-domain-containing protein [Patellaria atrata CBS 101060]|uniref:PQ-loop-domain-containing protein n=1 Tax=Patellaria atrata CBS 101060 TaxID=1346257 RepID=A0A9P4S869_9PEZI|nr:PQ-loop-domain-containing protein [Patellaria atrata CBS 101060]